MSHVRCPMPAVRPDRARRFGPGTRASAWVATLFVRARRRLPACTPQPLALVCLH